MIANPRKLYKWKDRKSWFLKLMLHKPTKDKYNIMSHIPVSNNRLYENVEEQAGWSPK